MISIYTLRHCYHKRLTYRRKNTILQRRFIDRMTEEAKIQAEKAGFDVAYLRFTGDVILEIIEDDKVVKNTREKPYGRKCTLVKCQLIIIELSWHFL